MGGSEAILCVSGESHKTDKKDEKTHHAIDERKSVLYVLKNLRKHFVSPFVGVQPC